MADTVTIDSEQYMRMRRVYDLFCEQVTAHDEAERLSKCTGTAAEERAKFARDRSRRATESLRAIAESIVKGGR